MADGSQVIHGADGIKCFAVHPGGVATELGRNMPETLHPYLSDAPDLAGCFAIWLCSGHADWARGAVSERDVGRGGTDGNEEGDIAGRSAGEPAADEGVTGPFAVKEESRPSSG